VASAICALAVPSYAAHVARVIDGDTIALNDGTTIRYIGVDSPETKSQQQASDLVAKQATAYNELLVLGKDILLEYDVERTDRYGRTLAYVYAEGVFVNAEMVRAGFAKVLTIPPDVLHAEMFDKCQEEARAAGVGLWATGDAQPLVSATPQTESAKYYITKTGSKYHRAGCRYLSKSAFEITREDAIAQGYAPCSVCVGAAPAANGSSSYMASPSTSSPGRCQAITKKGTQCKRAAKPGSNYCWQHGG
jgi:micrococcal nuclease